MMRYDSERQPKRRTVMTSRDLRGVALGLLVVMFGGASAFLGAPSPANALSDYAPSPDIPFPLQDYALRLLNVKSVCALDQEYSAAKARLDAEYACRKVSLQSCVKSPERLASCLSALACTYERLIAQLSDVRCRKQRLLATTDQTRNF
jgi:hypothetical protein